MAKKLIQLDRKDFVPALWDSLRSGYGLAQLGKDARAGLFVGAIALPLGMAFAIGGGAHPVQGLYAVAVAGIVMPLLSGSRFQVPGTTGAFIVIMASILGNPRMGMPGLLMATALAGIMLVALGASGLGKLVRYIPYPVTTAFRTGIGVAAFARQIKDIGGFTIEAPSADFVTRLGQYAANLSTVQLAPFIMGVAVVAAVFAMRRFAPRLPAAIIALGSATLATYLFSIPVDTVATRFGTLSGGIPILSMPLSLEWNALRESFPSAITIAFIVALESLLSSAAADGLVGAKTKVNAELIAQGVGNIAVAMAGGIPVTGAIARTVTNAKSGAVSPLSAMFQALVVWIFLIFLMPVASAIPMTALAALLVVIAWDISDIPRFAALRKGSKSDFTVAIVTFSTTLLIDLTTAVQVGVLLSVFLFVKRMSDTTTVRDANESQDDDGHGVGDGVRSLMPHGCDAYEISGPFFFGVADILQETLDQVERPPKVFALIMENVPAIDATGLNALMTFAVRCKRHHTTLLVVSARGAVRASMEKTGFVDFVGADNMVGDAETAAKRAREIIGSER
jgi:SulP family sulfate permease